MGNLARIKGKEISSTSRDAKERKHTGMHWNEKIKRKQLINLTRQHKEIKQRVLAKERRFKNADTKYCNTM